MSTPNNRKPPKSKIDRLLAYYIKFQDLKDEIKQQYGVNDNYLHGQMKVAQSKRTKQ